MASTLFRTIPMDRRSAPLDRHVLDAISAYARVLREDGVRVTRLLLFGSYARGTPHAGSDIDLAVISPDFGKDFHDERVRLMKLARRASRLIEPHPLRPEDLEDRWSTLAGEIREYGVEVE